MADTSPILSHDGSLVNCPKLMVTPNESRRSDQKQLNNQRSRDSAATRAFRDYRARTGFRRGSSA